MHNILIYQQFIDTHIQLHLPKKLVFHLFLVVYSHYVTCIRETKNSIHCKMYGYQTYHAYHLSYYKNN